MKRSGYLLLIGVAAGAVNGLLGAGGGMVLVPLLSLSGAVQEEQVFPASVCIILPISILSLALTYQPVPGVLTTALLLGSAIGGIGAGFLSRKIPTKWLHRGLGILILWGGIRYLC